MKKLASILMISGITIMKKRMICIMLMLMMTVFLFTGCVAKEEAESLVSQNDEINVTENVEKETTGTEVGETKTTTENEKISEESPADLTEEILAVEEASLELQNQLQMASTQMDMNVASGQIYQLWDDELNSLWARFNEAASEECKATVLAAQRNWIKEKEDKIKFARVQYEDGSMQAFIENTTASELTRIRCYELAGYLAEATGQDFELEVPKQEVLDFVDRQGTADIYSELIMERTAGNNCTATILLYRLTTLDGNAIMQNDDVYEFEDETLGIKGIIRVLDGGSWATFEITETEWSLVNVGDVFEFQERK